MHNRLWLGAVVKSQHPAVAALAECQQQISAAMMAWWTGAQPCPDLTVVREALPQASWFALKDAAQGGVALENMQRALAARVHAIVDHAELLDAAAGAWSNAEADVEGQRCTVERALAVALVESDPFHARLWWQQGRAPLVDAAHAFVEPYVHAMGSATDGPDPDMRDPARAFLAATADLWADALGFQDKASGQPRGLPSALRHFRVMAAPAWAENVPTAASRHLARQAVEHVLAGDMLGTLRRVTMRPQVGLPALGTLSASNAPRVLWPERRGMPAALELVGATVEAVAMWAHPQPDQGRGIAVLGQAATLGALQRPVLVKGLGMDRGAAARQQRHGALALLREARVRAALARDPPHHLEQVREALASATGAEPDMVEAAARMALWPQPGPALRLANACPGTRLGLLFDAAALAHAAQQTFDLDWLCRPACQQAWHQSFTREAPTLMEDFGANPEQGAVLLRQQLETWLG